MKPSKEQFCFVDIETASKTDINNGVENYFADPSAHILVICFKLPGEKKIRHVTNFDRKRKIDIPVALKNFKGTYVAHNESFERTAFAVFAPGTRLAKSDAWLCTMALAHRFNLPGSLGACADALKLSNRKNPDGRRLISEYSIPDKKTGEFRSIPAADQIKWVDYCEDDIPPSEGIFNLLFPLWGETEREYFEVDKIINTRGIPIDVAGARRIEKAWYKFLLKAEKEAEVLAGRTEGGALAINSPEGFKQFFGPIR